MNDPKQDRRIFETVIRSLEKRKTSAHSPDHLVPEVSMFFLGTPYEGGTLESEGPERLVVNLRAFDCVTFVETVSALAHLIGSGKKSFRAFRILLWRIRYRQGRLRGYASRLHYFSDWIHDNQKKGILKDVTPEMGGRSFKKAMNFMTTHPGLYPSLRDAAALRGMRAVERVISKRSHFFVPRRNVRHIESQVREGDILAVTTALKGIDVQHVGFAVRRKGGIHLLHASSTEGRVVLSKPPLQRYLMQRKTHSGIMVARILAKGRDRKSEYTGSPDDPKRIGRGRDAGFPTASQNSL